MRELPPATTVVDPPRSDADRIGWASVIPARLARAAVTTLGRRLPWGSILLEDAVGDERLGLGEPKALVRVKDPRAYAALMAEGSVGLGSSYIEGWWDSDELTDLVRILVHNRGAAGRARDALGRAVAKVLDPISHLARPSMAADGRNVRAHYDIGDAFFALMLDPTLTYSCALFERPEATLEEASIAKLDRICQKLRLREADHVIEIGTGWGGFAVHAASRYGCRVTTTTVSERQYEYAREWVARAGLEARVTVLREDYRELRGTYDKLASIEMIEAVDWRLLDDYVRACASLLRPEGLMALQAITIADESYDRAKRGRDFIKAFVFPGSCLPSVPALVRSFSRARLAVVGLEDIGLHYAETLRRWRGNVEAHREEIAALGYDERFLRMWRLYLAYCEAAFLERHISDVQVVLAKPGWRPSQALAA